MDKAGRDRIEIDHRRPLAGNVIDHDVVYLGITVEHSLFKFAALLRLFETERKIAAF